MDVRLYWIWLSRALKPGNPHIGTLLRSFRHPRAVYEADRRTLEDAGVPEQTIAALGRKSLDEAEKILSDTLQNGCWILTPDDALYPPSLLNLPDLPPVLYGRGDWNGWDLPAIAVVGSRHISPAGAARTAQLTAGLVAGGMAIVSGGAVGGDAAAMEAALDCGGLCLSVQACGLDVHYPTETAPLRDRLLRQGGILLSEYPLGVTPGRGTFQVRNRLIAGLALGTLVTEAQERSGTLITAHCARDQGHDVFAVPGDETLCGGCHRLIREGAQLVTNCVNILEEYLPAYGHLLDVPAARMAEADFRRRQAPLPEESPAASKPKRAAKQKTKEEKSAPPKPRPPKPSGLSDAAGRLYDALSDTPKGADDLASESGLSPAAVLAALTELELTGCVQNLAGRQYVWKG